MNPPYDAVSTARIELSDGTERTLESEAEQLYFALAPYHEANEYEEGTGRADKSIQELGGRNEFERGRQKKIVDWLASAEVEGRKRVMLIGDSIRMRVADSTGYGVRAYRQLIRDFNISHVPHNTGSTLQVLDYLDNWLTPQPDTVFINAGLHDLAYSQIEGIVVGGIPLENYAVNVSTILDRIGRHGIPNVIWALCTPVQEDWHRHVPGTTRLRKVGRRNADIASYNEAARQVAEAHGVEVVDMATAMREAGLEECLLRDGVHLSRKGATVLAEVASDRIRRRT